MLGVVAENEYGWRHSLPPAYNVLSGHYILLMRQGFGQKPVARATRPLLKAL